MKAKIQNKRKNKFGKHDLKRKRDNNNNKSKSLIYKKKNV